jgi:hypothetical protein
MAKSTGPILATGGITFLNQWIGNDNPPDWTILVATGIAAGGFYLFEEISPPLAVGIAWIAFVTSFLVAPAHGNSAVTNIERLTGLGNTTKK